MTHDETMKLFLSAIRNKKIYVNDRECTIKELEIEDDIIQMLVFVGIDDFFDKNMDDIKQTAKDILNN